jgi:hypothetical protein
MGVRCTSASSVTTGEFIRCEYSEFITALGLLDLGCYCVALSMGQLPFQTLQPCTHNGFAHSSLPFGVMLASTMLEVGNYPNDTGLTLLSLFNRSVLEQGTSFASLGRSLNSCL